MKKGFRLGKQAAVLLCALLLLPALWLPALADDGDFPGGTVIPDPPSQGDISIPEPPPNSDPEPPSEPPVSSDPEPPISSEPESSDEPSSEPPAYGPEESSENSTGTAAVNPNPTPRRSGGTTISKPSSSRPTLALGSPGPASVAPVDSSSLTPNYITFARLDQKANSMSMTLFYGGAACVLFGVLGLLLLLILFIRGRRTRYYDERDGIFEEIAQAENRGNPYASRQTYVPPAPIQPDLQRKRPQPPPSPPPQQPPYYDPSPRQDSLYTEEFDLPLAPPPQESLYTEEFELPEPAHRQAYEPPMQESLYTEEFDLPEPAAPPRHSPPAHQARNPYDTDEILRELLGKDK